MHVGWVSACLTCNIEEFAMKNKDCLDALVPHESAVEGLAQRVVEVLSASKDSLQKVSEVKVSIVPVIAYSVELTFIP